MRSAARLTYERAQAAIDGRTDAVTSLLLEPVLKPLYGAYRALMQAREARGALWKSRCGTPSAHDRMRHVPFVSSAARGWR